MVVLTGSSAGAVDCACCRVFPACPPPFGCQTTLSGSAQNPESGKACPAALPVCGWRQTRRILLLQVKLHHLWGRTLMSILIVV